MSDTISFQKLLNNVVGDNNVKDMKSIILLSDYVKQYIVNKEAEIDRLKHKLYELQADNARLNNSLIIKCE